MHYISAYTYSSFFFDIFTLTHFYNIKKINKKKLGFFCVVLSIAQKSERTVTLMHYIFLLLIPMLSEWSSQQ